MLMKKRILVDSSRLMPRARWYGVVEVVDMPSTGLARLPCGAVYLVCAFVQLSSVSLMQINSCAVFRLVQ